MRASGFSGTGLMACLTAGLAVGVAPSGAAAAAQICINEILYDPDGPDAGAEFVELYNGGTTSVSLDGWSLEAGNGSAPGDWRRQWRGEAADRIAPAGYFLIAGSRVTPAGDVEVELALQNGPDAVRLRSPSGVIDCVGWGALEFAEYYEGAPTGGTPSGSVLARMPDGADCDNNALDLRVRSFPTPRATNAPPTALAIVALHCDPPLLDERSSGELLVSLMNCGAQPVELGALACEVACPLLEAVSRHTSGGTLHPDQSADFLWDLQAHEVQAIDTLRVSVNGGGSDPLVQRIPLRVGRGAVLITEVSYDPAGDEGEWIELWNRSDQTVDLSGWRLRDASGRATLLGPLEARLAPQGIGLVAEDPEALRGRWPQIDPRTLLRRRDAWPSLNNTLDRQLGYADEVLLTDAEDVPVDYVRYAPGGLDGAGVSLERWISDGRLTDPRALVPCAAPQGGTPGALGAGGARQGGSEWFDPQPNPFYPDRPDGERFCHVALPSLASAPGDVTADIFTMSGRRVVTLATQARCGGPLLLVWDGSSAAGSPLPTGIYLMRAVLRSPSSSRTVVKPIALVRN